MTQPYRCSQEPHPGAEFYGEAGGCAECGYRPHPEWNCPNCRDCEGCGGGSGITPKHWLISSRGGRFARPSLHYEPRMRRDRT